MRRRLKGIPLWGIPNEMNLVTTSGDGRVGPEDGVRLARRHAEQVPKIHALLETFLLEIPTPQEARTTLGLRGRKKEM
jgi:uncharacterized protein (DUF849 family)